MSVTSADQAWEMVPLTGESDGQDIANKPIAKVASVPTRMQTPVYLLNAGLFFFFATVITIGITLQEFFTIKTNFRGEPFTSGHGWFPPTVSYVVYDWNTAQGRIWFAGGLVGALFLFMSNYPFELRNVFTGDEAITFCGKHILYWTTMRQNLPIVGGVLLIVPLGLPQEVAGPIEILVRLHQASAVLLFGAYMLSEMRILGIFCFSGSEVIKKANLSDGEIRTRSWLMGIALLCSIIFLASAFNTAVLSNQFCCPNRYAFTTLVANISGTVMPVPTTVLGGSALVEQTASGTTFILHIVTFVSETIVLLSLILSQLAIWYYCEERQATFDGIRLAPLKDIMA